MTGEIDAVFASDKTHNIKEEFLTESDNSIKYECDSLDAVAVYMIY